MGYAHDGAHLTQHRVLPTVCEGCGEPLGAEQWWVIDFPRAVHTRCRDWEACCFPYEGKLEVCERLERQLRRDGELEAASLVKATVLWFQRRRQVWPADAIQTVNSGSRLAERLRSKLTHLGITSKLKNHF